MVNELSVITLNLSIIFFTIGLFCVFWKIKNRKRYNLVPYINKKRIIFKFHIVAFNLSIIFVYIHIMPISYSLSYFYSGWTLGIAMYSLSLLGFYLGKNNKWKPLEEPQDHKFRNIRMIMWILTIISIVSLVIHLLIFYLIINF